MTADLLVSMYGRSQKYNDTTWETVAGSLEDETYLTFKAQADSACPDYFNISEITLPNGDTLNVPHFWAALNGAINGHGDLCGWARDLVQLAQSIKTDNTATFPGGGFSSEDWTADADAAILQKNHPGSVVDNMENYFQNINETSRIAQFKALNEGTINERFTNSEDAGYLAVLMAGKATKEDITLAANSMQEYLDASSPI